MDPSYNNSFGSFGNNGEQSGQPVVIGNSSDIVLPGQKKKKKIVLAIVIVMIILAIIGGSVAAALILTGNKQANDSVAKRNSFINLVFVGEKETGSIKEVGADSELYISSHYDDEAYVTELMDAFDSYQESMVQEGKDISEYSFSNIRNNILFLKEYKEIKTFTVDELTTLLNEYGDDADNYVISVLWKNQKDELDEDYNYVLDLAINSEYGRVTGILNRLKNGLPISSFSEKSAVDNFVNNSLLYISEQCEVLIEGVNNNEE